MAKTSINIQPMKAGSERHNLRHKELSYIRKDLSHLNESWIDPRYEGKSMSEVREDIARRYKSAVGQKLQKTAQPLREAVVVIGDNHHHGAAATTRHGPGTAIRHQDYADPYPS